MKKRRKRKLHYKHPRHYVKNGPPVAGMLGWKSPRNVPALDEHLHEPPTLEPVAKQADPWLHRAQSMLCQTCMYFILKPGGGSTHEVGRCRRRAPSPEGSLGWPVVMTNDWCGQHKLDE